VGRFDRRIVDSSDGLLDRPQDALRTAAGVELVLIFVAAYTFAVGFAVRTYWAFVGNSYSREIFLPTVGRPEWWRRMWQHVRYYATFGTYEKQVAAGHDPLAQTAIFLFSTLGSLFMIFTFFALYSQGRGREVGPTWRSAG
jgi:Ni,Fe-hydrogenase I cytochrome b subunit